MGKVRWGKGGGKGEGKMVEGEVGREGKMGEGEVGKER